MQMGIVSTAAAVLVLGCGGGGTGEARPGCGYPALRLCASYTSDLSAELTAQLRTACEGEGGTWGSCPAGPVMGTCVIGAGETELLFYAGYVCSVEDARAACSTIEGTTFTPGSATCGPATEQRVACDLRPAHAACVEWSGLLAPERVATLEGHCAYGEGSLLGLGDACPLASTGACEVVIGGETYRAQHYDPTTAAADAADCTEAGGTWTPAGP